jgi:hypothetical protein
MNKLILLALLLVPGQAAKTQVIDSALTRINTFMRLQQEMSPFETRETADGTDSIEWLNVQIQNGLMYWLNHPSFQPDIHFPLLSNFRLNSSTDQKITAIGFYLNNGGTWQMQYTGFYSRAGGRNRFIPDTEEYPVLYDDSLSMVFKPFTGGVCLLIAPVGGLPGYYVYHVQTVYCATCIGERIGFFRLDSSGNPVPAYLFYDDSNDLKAEYRYGSEGLRFDARKNRILLQLNRDDLSEGWFIEAKTNKSLKASWLLQEGRFKKERFSYSRRSR